MMKGGHFAGIASAAAVVLSLVFVALEVRESSRQTELNTQSLQVSAYQDLIAQIADVNIVMLENPGLIDIGPPGPWSRFVYFRGEQP